MGLMGGMGIMGIMGIMGGMFDLGLRVGDVKTL
jgi:hypothetical protein